MLSLPSSLYHNPTVEVLLLDQNLFTFLPPVLQTLPRLHTLGLRGNILSSPPLHVIDQGVRGIQSWLAQVAFKSIMKSFAKIQNSGLGENFSWTLVMAFELFRSDVNEDRSLQRLLVILNNVMWFWFYIRNPTKKTSGRKVTQGEREKKMLLIVDT